MSGAYKPPWYPNQDPHHNPWFTVNETGETHYEIWAKSLEPGELKALIAEHQAKREGAKAA